MVTFSAPIAQVINDSPKIALGAAIGYFINLRKLGASPDSCNVAKFVAIAFLVKSAIEPFINSENNRSPQGRLNNASVRYFSSIALAAIAVHVMKLDIKLGRAAFYTAGTFAIVRMLSSLFYQKDVTETLNVIGA